MERAPPALAHDQTRCRVSATGQKRTVAGFHTSSNLRSMHRSQHGPKRYAASQRCDALIKEMALLFTVPRGLRAGSCR